MSLEIDLSSSPYWDDLDPKKDYYRVLFKPSMAVQTRELNQLQNMLQTQIERFGDTVFQKGTILSGCNFVFHTVYPYVKIKDIDLQGLSTVPSLYQGCFVKNSANMTAYIVNYADGFETGDPDLKTLFVSYTNSGNTNDATSFSPDETLTIYDSLNSLYEVTITNGGLNFTNNDTVVFTSAIGVRVDTGTFTVGEYVVCPSTGANLQITDIDTSIRASQGLVVLTLKPRNVDMSNASANSINWSFNAQDDIKNVSNTVAASVVTFLGSGAAAKLATNTTGKINSIRLTDNGQDYIKPPTVTVHSSNNSSGVAVLDLSAVNFITQVKVSAGANAVGNGYAFSVQEGIIYQKGHFLTVDGQTIVIDKYDTSPNNVVVGFKTLEEIVDFNVDPTLLDNATGAPNETAPGADRLKLTPILSLLTVDEANANQDFFSICEWSGGFPFKQNQYTQYSKIGDEMAQRAYDESGNFVIDTFQVATSSVANGQLEGTYYTAVVDPGQAYISGYKVQTLRNYYIDVPKGTNSKIANSFVSLDYGNYIRVKEVGGLFQFSTASQISLYDTATTFLTRFKANTAITPASSGTLMGTARVRSMVLETGTAGDVNAVYRLYLFDIQLAASKNFRNIRSIYYGGTNPGSADLVLELDATTSTNVALLKGATVTNGLLFNSGVESIKNTNNTIYTYRTIDQQAAVSNTGVLVKSIASSPNEFYPYTGALSTSELNNLYVVPLGNTLTQYDTTNGSITAVSGNTTVTGSNVNFISDYAAGDYIQIAHATNTLLSITTSINYIINSTAMVIGSAPGFSNTALAGRRVFPKNIPIPFGTRTGLSANVDANGNVLTVKFAHANGANLTFAGTTTVNTAIGVNIQRTGVTSTSKTATRQRYIKINCANNSDTNVGPWCLGVPDAFRLRKVYTSTDVSSIDTTSSDVTENFYIDHNQTQDYLGLSYLYLNPRSKIGLSANAALLVYFDYGVRQSDGYFDTVSYVHTSNTAGIATNDSLPLANLTTTYNSLEVPEVNGKKNTYFDLLNQLDFRPAVTPTASPSLSVNTAPINPAETISFGNTADPANDKKFPLPESTCTTQIEYYMGRVDVAFIGGQDGEITVIKGIPDPDPRRRLEPNHPKDSLRLQSITVPAYPNISDVLTPQVKSIVRTGLFNERSSNIRLKSHVISPILSSYEFQLSQPMVYTMEDIAALERRIKDLEYYQALSILETSITNKPIPSSVDPTLNRFKFGFMADDFSTEVYSDVENPQYAASIESEGQSDFGSAKSPLETETNWGNADKNTPTSTTLSPSKLVQKKTNKLVPPKFIWTLSHFTENNDYIDFLAITQLNATRNTTPATPPTGPKVPATPPTGPKVPACVPKIIGQVTINGTTSTVNSANAIVLVAQQATFAITDITELSSISTTPVVTDSNFGGFGFTASTLERRVYQQAVTAAPIAGKVRLFVYSPNGAAFEIYKGGVLIGSTQPGGGYTAVPANLKSALGSSDLYDSFWGTITNRTTVLNAASSTSVLGGLTIATGLGYFEFDRTATDSTNYVVKITSTEKTDRFATLRTAFGGFQNRDEAATRFVFEYPSSPLSINLKDAVGQVTTQVDPCLPTTISLYIGSFKPYTNYVFQWACSKTLTINNVRRAAWGFQVAGLKPNTKHSFYVDGKDLTIWTVQTNSNSTTFGVSGSLTSDAQGKMTFVFFLPDDQYNESWLTSIGTSSARTTFGSSGYSTLMVKAPGSTASKLVAKRDAGKPLPFNPAGSP